MWWLTLWCQTLYVGFSLICHPSVACQCLFAYGLREVQFDHRLCVHSKIPESYKSLKAAQSCNIIWNHLIQWRFNMRELWAVDVVNVKQNVSYWCWIEAISHVIDFIYQCWIYMLCLLSFWLHLHLESVLFYTTMWSHTSVCISVQSENRVVDFISSFTGVM